MTLINSIENILEEAKANRIKIINIKERKHYTRERTHVTKKP